MSLRRSTSARLDPIDNPRLPPQKAGNERIHHCSGHTLRNCSGYQTSSFSAWEREARPNCVLWAKYIAIRPEPNGFDTATEVELPKFHPTRQRTASSKATCREARPEWLRLSQRRPIQSRYIAPMMWLSSAAGAKFVKIGVVALSGRCVEVSIR